MTPEQAAASSGAAPSQKSFKYDQKQMVKRKGDGKSQKQQNPRKEDANLAVTEVLTEFSYMVEDQFVVGDDEQEILLASIPTGCWGRYCNCISGSIPAEWSSSSSRCRIAAC